MKPTVLRLLQGLFVFAALGAVGCASSSKDDRHSAGVEDEVPGAVGSHVWRATSASVTLDTYWSYQRLNGTGVASSGSTSATYELAELSPDALARLESLKLIPLGGGCTADGFRYDVLTVVDADGTSASHADTGCDYLRLEGATAMLSYAEVQLLMLAGD